MVNSNPEHFQPADLPLLCVYADAVVQARACAKLVREGSCTDPVIKAQRNALSAVFQLSMRLRVSPQARQVRKSLGSNTRPPSVSYYDRLALEMIDEETEQGHREAMERAIAVSLESRDRAEAERVRDMLRTRPRAEVGWSCAISCQEKVLRTRPWQPVPAADYVAVTDRDDEGSPIMGRAAAAELLRRLLAAGLSRYEPDPLRALARIEAERGT